MYSVLVVRTAPQHLPRSAADLTARARIRDAAIECFATQGFDASFRTIAAAADVSPGLITHHFGPKTALRAECDAEVLRRYDVHKREAVADPSGQLMEQLAVPGPAAVVLVYMLRAVQAGGQPARDFLENLVDHARDVMARSAAAGLIRPSRDEEARLRYLTYQTMGAMLVRLLVEPPATPDDFVASMRRHGADEILPILEVYTEGLFVDRRMLDDYLMYVGDPPAQEAPPSGSEDDRAPADGVRTA